MKKSIRFKSRVGISSYLPGMHYLEVPKKVIEEFGGGFKRRYVCRLADFEFPCGVMALGEGKGFIMLSKKRMADADVIEGSRPEISLKVDESKYGMEVPKEWSAVLAQDAKGRSRFAKLTPGKQRYVLQFVGSVKNPDLRLERSMRVLRNLKALPAGGGSYREIFAEAGVLEEAIPSSKAAKKRDLKVVSFADLEPREARRSKKT